MLNSLRYQFLIALVSLAIIPIVSIVYILTLQSTRILEQEAIASQELTARQVATEIDSFIDERENELAMLSQVRGLTRLEYDEQVTLLESFLAFQRNYQAISLLDAQGEEIIHLSRTQISSETNLEDRSESEMFQEAINMPSAYFSPVYFNEATREPLMTVALSLRDLVTNDVVYVLVGEIRFRSVWDLIADLNLAQEDNEVYVTTLDGLIVAHSNPTVVLSETSIDLPDESARTAGLSSDDVILGYTPLLFGKQELAVVAERSSSDALQFVGQITSVAIIVTLITLTIAILLVFALARFLIRPIEKLAQTTQLIGEGDFSLKAEVGGSIELRRLATSINTMANDLSQFIGYLEQRIAERTQELEEAKRLAEESNQIKSQFLANMSHELRTPLNAILNFTGFVARGVMGPVNERQAETLKEAIDSGKHLLSLINDILDITKIEAGLMDLFVQEVNLNEVMSATESIAKGLIKDRPLTLNVDIQENLPTTYGDKRRLRQVMLNLVSNAVKFTEEGTITLIAKEDDGKIRIQVKDTGIGIAPENRESIFQSFKQVQNTLQEAIGTGLGLPISKFFVEIHRGQLELESEVGVGSAFSVTLPILTEEQAKTINEQLVAKV